MRRLHLALALGVLALGAAACHEAARSLDDTPAAARARSDALFSALADRFGPVLLSPELATLRPRLLRGALAPSLVHADAGVWTRTAGETREIVFTATRPGDAYRMGLARDAPAPSAPGDYRGRLTLERLGRDEYRWTMREELAVGPLSPAGVGRAAAALLRELEAAPPGDARALLRAALPRATAHLGRVFSLDSFTITRRPQGGAAIGLAASLQSERIAASLPRYAAFLKKHVASMRSGLLEEDDAGRLWEAGLRDGRLFLRFAVREGRLAPLSGPPRRQPDHVRFRQELTSKPGLFRVGFEDLVGDVVRHRGPALLGLDIAYREEPDWRLPFLIEPLLRASLRRPFEGEGAFASYALEPHEGASSLLVRSFRLTVRESWVVRWLGGRVDGTVSDFRAGAEAEADRFTRELLLSLREDIAELQR